ncbi:cytochrome p450 [Seiridium cupressi]
MMESSILFEPLSRHFILSIAMTIIFGVLIIPLFQADQSSAPTLRIIEFTRKLFHAWSYLFVGPSIIIDEFQRCGEKPFEVNSPDVRMVFVSSPKHIKELDNAPDAVLSLNGAAKHLLPDLGLLTRLRWAKLLSNASQEKGITHARIYPMIMDLVVLLNARSLFDEELTKNESFMASALGYVEETLLNAEITIVYVIQDLSLHPEYIEPIRRELQQSYTDFERTGRGLPLLDSFIKESARLTPVESISVRRCALQPFSLSDGTKVGVGDWACPPSGAINNSAEYYPSPQEFSGFRFVDPKILLEMDGITPSAAMQSKPTKITDADYSFLMWGTGRMACPGIFYAAAFMKVVVAQLIMNYDFTLMKPDAPRWITWRTAKIPRPWTKMAFSKRQ